LQGIVDWGPRKYGYWPGGTLAEASGGQVFGVQGSRGVAGPLVPVFPILALLPFWAGSALIWAEL